MTKSRLAAIWDDPEGGWYFKADNHEGVYPHYMHWDLNDPHMDEKDLETAAREHAIYCGVSPAGNVEILR